MTVIDTHIPPPVPTGPPAPKPAQSWDLPCGRPAKYPLRRLCVGHSFFEPLGGREAKAVSSSIHSGARYIFGGAGHVSTATKIKGGVEGVRVWRIK